MSLESSTAKGANAAIAVSTSPMAGSFSDRTAVHARALRSCGARSAKSKGRRSGGAVATEAAALPAAAAPLAPGFAATEVAGAVLGAAEAAGGTAAFAAVVPGGDTLMPAAGVAEGAPVGDACVAGRPKFGIFF